MSDNAKTFKHCAKEVMKVIRSEEVRQQMTNKQIQWTFIAEKAPWWGGLLGKNGQKRETLLEKGRGKLYLKI